MLTICYQCRKTSDYGNVLFPPPSREENHNDVQGDYANAGAAATYATRAYHNSQVKARTAKMATTSLQMQRRGGTSSGPRAVVSRGQGATTAGGTVQRSVRIPSHLDTNMPFTVSIKKRVAGTSHETNAFKTPEGRRKVVTAPGEDDIPFENEILQRSNNAGHDIK